MLLNRRAAAIAVFLLAAAGLMVGAWSKDYRLELTVVTDKQEDYLLVVDLDQREFKRLENDPHTEIATYLLQARRTYADQIGYRREIYGEENYKMVKVVSYDFVVKDIGRGNVVLRKR
jgi:hypothetical protein